MILWYAIKGLIKLVVFLPVALILGLFCMVLFIPCMVIAMGGSYVAMEKWEDIYDTCGEFISRTLNNTIGTN